MLKDIIKNLEPSSTLRINEISRELEEKGKKIFKFGFGQSPFEVPIEIINALKIMLIKINIYQCKGLKHWENQLLNIHL